MNSTRRVESVLGLRGLQLGPSFGAEHAKDPQQVLKDQFGKRFWGTRGKYVKKHMIDSFLMELGYEYDDLLEGADEDDEGISKSDQELRTLVATQQIQISNQSKDDDKEEQEISESQSEG